jgi:hypothetical protein
MKFWSFECGGDEKPLLKSSKVAALFSKAKKSIKIICSEEEAMQIIKGIKELTHDTTGT